MKENVLEIVEKIVKDSEGLHLEAYLCPADVWSIGWGRTKGVIEGMRITEEQAVLFLKEDLRETFIQLRALLRKNKINNLNSNIKGGLLSLGFNIGIGRLANSSIIEHLKAGDYLGAGLLILSFRKANKRYFRGLQYRRALEANLYFGFYNTENKLLNTVKAYPIFKPCKELTIKGLVISEQEFDSKFAFPF